MRSNTSSDLSYKVTMVSKDFKLIPKTTKKDWEPRTQSIITEVCIKELSFSAVEGNEEKKVSLQLN